MKSAAMFREIFRDVLKNGVVCSPRGMKCIEVEDAKIVVPPIPLMSFEGRNLSLDYLRREFQWYLTGSKHNLDIVKHAKIWEKHINRDGTLNSNYGYYLFRKHGLYDAAAVLREDRDSRRAFCSIANSEQHLWDKDVPCTYSLSWRIRDGQLNQTVHMRSNDLVLGAGSDWPIFTWIHHMMLCILRNAYPRLALGRYVHTADSLHIYERHFDLAGRIASGVAEYTEISIPQIANAAEANSLIARDGGHSEFDFSNWLYEVEL